MGLSYDVCKYKNGNIEREMWRLNGNFHREDGPAKKIYYKNGMLKSEYWLINNNFHKEDGPAMIEYSENGMKTSEYWYKNDLFHREDGPAIICYNNNGEIEREEYYLNNKEIEMDISHVALEMFLRKQLKNIYKIKVRAYIRYLKRIAVLRPYL